MNHPDSYIPKSRVVLCAKCVCLLKNNYLIVIS